MVGAAVLADINKLYIICVDKDQEEEQKTSSVIIITGE
jgi:hypothetical protein